MGNLLAPPPGRVTYRLAPPLTATAVLGALRHAYTAEDELVLCVPRGTITLMHSNVWHRVDPNESDVLRKNFFLAYCPSWIVAADRLQSDPEWLASLSREQRIIMRSYTNAYDHTKPPAADFPLFLDRETGLDHDLDKYLPHVKRERRKRMLAHEKHEAVRLDLLCDP